MADGLLQATTPSLQNTNVNTPPVSLVADIIIATLLEPFSFQLLRQAGAAWGWISFLTRRQRWGTQSRTTLVDRATVPVSPSR